MMMHSIQTPKPIELSELSTLQGIENYRRSRPCFHCRLWRRSTVDGFLADISFYLRTIPCFVLLSADYRLGLYLVLWNLVSFLLLPPGRYRGANEITPLTPTSLDSLAMNEAGKETWLVMLSAPWSAKSLQAQHTFSELSNEYSSESLKFGELEVSRWPKIAVKFDVNIESIPHQLPTFLLFKHGQLVKRLPEKDDMWQKKTRLRTQIVNHFELDMHMAKGMWVSRTTLGYRQVRVTP